jgi:putative transposase
MSTDPNESVPSEPISESTKTQIQTLLASGLADFSLRELLGTLLSGVSVAERNLHLEHRPEDRPNGFYDRSLQVGSVPIDIRVPRTRLGDFRPANLPSPYQRGYPEEIESLLLGLLASSRSINAAREALQKMGLSGSQQDLDRVAAGLIEELDLGNSRPLDTDLLALFVDGKYVELRDGDRLRPACIYLAVGLGRDGKKRVLACIVKPGRENLEDWKGVLRGLIERGLRRVMIFVQDDFSGLLKVSEGFFPNADVQLCVVHMQRNAKSHLSKADSTKFAQRFRAIKSSWSEDVGNCGFEELCDRFADDYPSWIVGLRKKRTHSLAFLKYPDLMRKFFSTTNLVEPVNGQLEIMRRNSGGYFHSEDTLKFKLGLAVSHLLDGRWKSPATSIHSALNQINAMFQSRFEDAS